MELRDPAMPDESGTPAPTDGFGQPRPDRPAATAGEWRVSRRFTAAKVGGILILAGAALAVHGDRIRMWFTLLAALVIALYAARDLLAPVRLAADRDGLTVVTGFATWRRLPWSGVERVRVDVRRRLGTRSEFLEIDTGDNLYLFSTYDLGVPCDEVAGALDEIRPPEPSGASEPAPDTA